MTTNFAGPTYNMKGLLKNKNTCSKWIRDDKFYGTFGLSIFQNANNDVVMNGRLTDYFLKMLTKVRIKLHYWAASPATNGDSFTGSGLPYATPEMAFENTPNRGVIDIYNINFKLNLMRPNSYYQHLGRELVRPQVNFMFMNDNNKPISRVFKIDIPHFYPYRTLSNPHQLKNIMSYYNPTLPIRTQEQILRDSQYPKNMKFYPHFWGTRPPP